MSKPVYEIPISGDEAGQPLGFPPPARDARPRNLSTAPPPSASGHAPTLPDGACGSASRARRRPSPPRAPLAPHRIGDPRPADSRPARRRRACRRPQRAAPVGPGRSGSSCRPRAEQHRAPAVRPLRSRRTPGCDTDRRAGCRRRSSYPPRTRLPSRRPSRAVRCADARATSRSRRRPPSRTSRRRRRRA